MLPNKTNGNSRVLRGTRELKLDEFGHFARKQGRVLRGTRELKQVRWQMPSDALVASFAGRVS